MRRFHALHVKWIVPVVCTMAFVVSTQSFAAVDMFLKYEFPGESTDPAHQGWIDVLHFTQGITLPLSGHRVVGPSQFQDFQITKNVDRASPRFFLAIAQAQQLTTATLQVYRLVGTANVKILEIVFQDIFVSSDKLDPTAVEDPTEILTLNVGRVRWTYFRYNVDGKFLDSLTTTWDILANKPAAVLPDLVKLE